MEWNSKKNLRHIVAFAVGILIIAALIHYLIGEKQFFESITTMDPFYMAIAIFVYFCAWLARGARLYGLIRFLGEKLGYWLGFRLHTAQFSMNVILPLKAGDFAAVLALRKHFGLVKAAAAIIQVRVLDLAALSIFAIVALLFMGLPEFVFYALLVVMVLLLGGMSAIILMNRTQVFDQVASRLGGVFLRRFSTEPETAVSRLTASYAKLLAPRAMFGGIGISLVIWSLDALTFFFVAKSLGCDFFLPFIIIGVVCGNLAKAVPATPGSIGIYEGVIVLVLVFLGLPEAAVGIVAILDHLLKNLFTLAIGLPNLPALGSRMLGFGKTDAHDSFQKPTATGKKEDSVLLSGLRGEEPASKDSGDVTHMEETESPKWEIIGARFWNVVNESKTFNMVATAFILFVVVLFRDYTLFASLKLWIAALGIIPLCFVLWYFDYPLGLRAILWGVLALVVYIYSQSYALESLIFPYGFTFLLFFGFTLGVWGLLYYRLLIGEPWSTTTGFVKLVMTNDDSTSGNFFQVIPQMLVPLTVFLFFLQSPTIAAFPDLLGNGHAWQFIIIPGGIFALAMVSHSIWHRRKRTRIHPKPKSFVDTSASKMIIIVIDGCRRDRLRDEKPNTPTLNRLAREGMEYTKVRTMYPARTSVCFSSMFTGKLPQVTGVKSNFVFSPVKCRSVFDVLERQGKKGVLIGIAHLLDIAHDNWNVRSVTSFMKNEVADEVIFGVARDVYTKEAPELLAVQLIAVDQTGHMRGSLGDDYLKAMEKADRDIGDFLKFLDLDNFFDDGVLLIMADHGQGRGIGGHGYWGKGEELVPMIIYGKGVPAGFISRKERSVMDVAPTILRVLGNDKQ